MLEGDPGHRAWIPDPHALPQLVAAACQVGDLGGVARQLDGFVVRRARLLTAAQPARSLSSTVKALAK